MAALVLAVACTAPASFLICASKLTHYVAQAVHYLLAPLGRQSIHQLLDRTAPKNLDLRQ
jgi:hypothetical protein